MIIVSQDKERIYNFDNLTNILATNTGKDEWCIKVIFLNLDFEVIGYYKTEERTKEVLQEIIKAIIEIRKAKEINEFFGMTTIPADTYYEMPED